MKKKKKRAVHELQNIVKEMNLSRALGDDDIALQGANILAAGLVIYEILTGDTLECIYVEENGCFMLGKV